MQALDINWVARPRTVTPLGLLLATAGLLCAAWVAQNYLELDAERSSLEARQARLNRAAKNGRSGKAVAVLPLARDDAQTAAQIDAQLQLPWDSLLHTLEQHSSPKVALMGLDVQAASHSVHLVGEARTMDDALAWVRQLRQAPQLQQLVLTSQEEKPAAGQKVQRFSLDASWSTAP